MLVYRQPSASHPGCDANSVCRVPWREEGTALARTSWVSPQPVAKALGAAGGRTLLWGWGWWVQPRSRPCSGSHLPPTAASGEVQSQGQGGLNGAAAAKPHLRQAGAPRQPGGEPRAGGRTPPPGSLRAPVQQPQAGPGGWSSRPCTERATRVQCVPGCQRHQSPGHIAAPGMEPGGHRGQWRRPGRPQPGLSRA